MTTTTTITEIDSTTDTISVRQGAVMVLSVRAGATGENVYTLPGESETTDSLEPLGPYTYGPYLQDQDFEITSTSGIVEAAVSFTDADSGGVVFSYVTDLPDVGRQGVIYVTADAAYYWSGSDFVPMGGGAGGDFTTLTASGLFTLTGVEATVTAFATGGKASATALSATKNFHRISVCATAADSVLMPAANVGEMHYLRNDGAAAAQVFGAGTDTINAVATATGVSLPAGTAILLFCLASGAWVTTNLTVQSAAPAALPSALAAYGTGAFGLDSDVNMAALHAMVVALRVSVIALQTALNNNKLIA